MEYLKMVGGLFMDGWGLLVLPALGFILPNPFVEKQFFRLGRACSFFLRQKIGPPGERVEKYFQGTIEAATRGLINGLDSDDED